MSALSALCEEFYQDETGQVDSQMQGTSYSVCNKCEFKGLHACLVFFLTAVCLFVCTCLDILVSQYIEGLKSPQMLTRSGSALALGSLPKAMINNNLKQV